MSFTELYNQIKKQNSQGGSQNSYGAGVTAGTPTQAVTAPMQTASGGTFQKLYQQIKERNSPVIDDSYIRKYLSDSQNFLNRSGSFQNWQSGRNAYDSSDEEYEDLVIRTNAIKQYLNENQIGGDLAAAVEEATKAILGSRTNLRNLQDYYRQWDDQSAFDDYQTQLGWYQKYQGKNYQDLSGMLNGMEDGDEKAWLTSFAYQTDLDEKKNLDLEAYSREIAALEQKLEDYDPDIDWTDTNQRKKVDAEIERMQDEINRRKQYLTQAQRIQKKDDLSAVADPESEKYDAAFDSKSGYVSTQQDGKLERLMSQYSMGYDDLTYEYINNQNGIRDEIKQKAGAYRKGETPFEEKGYDYMTEDEVGLYNYYYSMGGKASAEAYLDTIQEDLNQRKAVGMYQQMEGKTGAEMVFGVEAGLDQFKGGVKGAVRAVKGDDSYVAPSATQYASGMVREDLADDGIQLPAWLGGSSLGQMGYDAITTTANMAPSMAVGLISPNAGAAMMGVSAAGSAYQEKINEGYTKEQAAKYGAAIGASETALGAALSGIRAMGGAVTNHVIEKALKGVKNGVAKFFIELGGRVGSEALEEGIQEILTPVFSNHILNTDENIDWSQVAYSALLGGLSAGVLEGPGAVSNARNATQLTSNSTPELSKATETAENATPLPGNATVSKTKKTIQLTPDIESFSQQFGKQSEAVKRNYMEGQDLQEYEVGFQAAYAMGREGGNREALEKHVPYLSQSQREIAFNLGAEAAAAARSTAPKKAVTTARIVAEDGSVGDAVNVAEIVSMDENNMTFKLEDGRTVTDDALSFDNGQQVLSAVWDLGVDVKSANAILAESAANTAADADQAAGIEEAYRYGSHGYSMKQLVERGIDAGVLTDGQRQAAWEAGKISRQQAAAAAPKTVATAPKNAAGIYFDAGNGNVTAFSAESMKGLTGKRKAGVQAAVVLKKLGIGGSFHFFESYVNAEGQRVYKDMGGVEKAAPNGWYDPSDGSIHIDLNAGADADGLTLYTLSHELTHFVEQWSKPKYQALADFLIHNYEKAVSVDELVTTKQAALSESRGAEVSYDEAYSEVIADSMEAMLADGNVLEKLAELKSKDKSLFDKIREFFRNLANKIQEIYKGIEPDSEEGKAVLRMKDQIEQIQQLFAEAMVEAGVNFQAADVQKNTAREGRQFSDRKKKGMTVAEISAIQNIGRKSINAFTKQDIQSAEMFARRYWEEMGVKSPFFRAWFGDWRENDQTPVQIADQQSNARGIQKNEDTAWDIHVSGKVFNESGHRAKKNQGAAPYLPYINDIVKKAVLLDSYGIDAGKAKSANSLLMHSMYAVSDIGNGPELLKLYVEEMNDPNQDDTSKRAYQLQNIEKQQLGVQGSGINPSLITPTATVRNVADLFAVVKQHDPDFSPNPSSTVVNANGTPMEMYHGTSNSSFTVFNTYGGNFGLFGKGSYFTDNPEVADSYTRKGKGQNPGVYGVYLSIKNPMDMDAHADLNAWKKAFEDADLDPSYLNDVVTNEDAFRQLKENLADEEYLRWEAEDIVTEIIEGMGYDGITHIGGGRYGSKDGPKHRVYIAFEPEQIKSSTENIGTFDGSNPDIRYQDRSTGTSNRALLAGAFEELVTSPDELKFIRQYQENIGLLNEQEEILQELRAQIREISFGKGERDPQKLKQLQEEATKTANRIDIYDRKLLKLERAKPLRDVLDREREKVRKATRQKGQEAMEAYREKRRESAARKDARRKIRKTVMELNKLLNRGDKKKNVKDGMSEMVSKSLKLAEALFMDEYSNRDMLRNGVGTQLTDAEETAFREAYALLEKIESGAALESMEFDSEIEAQDYLRKLDGQLSGKMAKLKDVFARERKRLYGTTVSDLLGQLADEYSRLSEAEDGAVRAAKDENVYAHLLQLQQAVGGTTVRDMTLNQMETVADAFTMVLTTVRNANKMFAKNLKFKRDTLAAMVMGEIGAAVKKVSKLVRPGKNAIDSFSWNNLKPVYAFERLGSETLKTLYQNIRSGQDVWSRDMQDADAFRREQYRKHNRKSWNLEKQHRFEFESGIVDLSLEQIMSLYAYSRREQALDHLLKGGFVFSGSTEVMVKEHGIQRRYLKKDATAYNLTADELLQVVDTLTKEQKAFVEDMQTYLSDVMGGKGNEISLQMYGIKSYGEKNYFPIRSAGQYMERAKEDSFRKEQGQISIVNSGFTKSTTPKANNPITLDGFMNVWAEHVNEMSMYHGFALPMEDFRRVYNYSSPNMEVGNSQSVNAVIENAFGKAATGYIDQLYKDLNGGAVSDNRENLSKKLVGLHKKAAVFASASVVVQQPSAIVRAFALIDPRHFIGPKVDRKRHKQLWEEVKKYAPVAFVKEMGYFDTGMGRSARDFLQAEEYSGIREKMTALFKDADYRDEILGKAPALADELTWCSIWEAVKRETKTKNPNMDARSDAFLQMSGARFSEVIDKTQVYDSVLSRSANMRSKALHMNMLTSFLAEPTTSINMLEDALRTGDRQQLKRTVGAVYGSVLLNSLLVSLVYAARDDDEDETYLEKYLSSVAVEMVDGINPISYYPFLRDIWSIGQGFDVERADMSLITDFADAAKKVVQSILMVQQAGADEQQDAVGSLKDSLWGMTDSIASLTGLPVKNIRRDIEGAMNLIKTIHADLAGRKTTGLSLMDTVLGDVMGSIPIGNLLYSRNKRDRLYDAIQAGDAAYVQRLKAGYKSEDAYHNTIRQALRDNESRIWEAANAWNSGDMDTYLRIAKEIRGENRFEQDDIVLAIRAEANSMLESDSESASTVKGYFTNEKFGVALSQNNTGMADVIRKDLIDTKVANGKTREEAARSVESTARSQLKELFEDGSITGAAAEKLLVRYGGYDQEEAADKVADWKFESEYGFSYSERGDAYKNGEISQAELRSILMDVGGKTGEEADLQIQVYDWEAAGYDGATFASVRDYNEHCARYSVPKDVYLHIKKFSSNTKNDVDSNGKAISYSAMKKIMAEIGAQYTLTSAQKYAIARSLGWSEKNIEKYKTWY